MSLLKRTRAIVATVVNQLLGNTETINSQSIIVLEKDSAGYVLRCKGTITVTDAGAGYAKGCVYIKTDGSITTTVFINEGTTTSCDFNAIESSASTVTGVVAGNGLTGGGTEGTVTLNVAVADSSITVAADAISVATGGITNTKVADSIGTAGLVLPKTALFVYDFAVDGGVAGNIVCASAPTIPDNAVVWLKSYEVVTTLTSASDASTIAVGFTIDGPITTAIAISNVSNPWDQGAYAGAAGGLVTPLAKKLTGARVPGIVVAGGENLTAGKIVFQLEYWVSL